VLTGIMILLLCVVGQITTLVALSVFCVIKKLSDCLNSMLKHLLVDFKNHF
jgi:hypothetical protein